MVNNASSTTYSASLVRVSLAQVIRHCEQTPTGSLGKCELKYVGRMTNHIRLYTERLTDFDCPIFCKTTGAWLIRQNKKNTSRIRAKLNLRQPLYDSINQMLIPAERSFQKCLDLGLRNKALRDNSPSTDLIASFASAKRMS